MSAFRVALAQYPIERLASFQAFAAKIGRWVEQAVKGGARLLLFPEYGAMELVALLPQNVQQDLSASLEGMQAFFGAYDALFRQLASHHQVHILAPSFPLGRVNTATLYAPLGKSGAQEKRILTRFEREQWVMQAGKELRLFETALGKIGVAICYDCEFPLQVRALCEAGANLILVPSCTDALAGYSRVEVAARARALENQCFVGVAPLVGEAAWSPATDVNVGAAGLYGPPDLGFPSDGVLARGELNAPGWIYGEVDAEAVSRVRAEGQVFNFTHWHEQGPIALPNVLRVDLR
jgi:predicted amidohydrolase